MKQQLSLIEEEVDFKNIQTYSKPVDVSEIIPNHNIIENQYFIYPDGGKHPFAEYDEKLNTNDFPYILNKNSKGNGLTKVQHIVIRDTIVVFVYIN
jgi:hypothetical protein